MMSKFTQFTSKWKIWKNLKREQKHVCSYQGNSDLIGDITGRLRYSIPCRKPASFADLSHTEKKRQTRREKFLAEMDTILPWKMLLGQTEQHYPKVRRGRPPVGVERMLRIYFMQQWCGLGDSDMEENLYDIEVLRRCTGVDLSSVPDEITICKFCHFLSGRALPLTVLPRFNLQFTRNEIR